MNGSSKYCYGLTLLFLFTFFLPLNANENDAQIAQQYVQQVPVQPTPPSFTTPAQYYYNQNNPYAPSTNYPPYGFYGGFYGSPPPPTPSQAFPDKAASDALYRYIQSR